jgi:hypothetical protein
VARWCCSFVPCGGWTGCGFDTPQGHFLFYYLARCNLSTGPCVRSVGPAWPVGPDLWDPCVRSARLVEPMCQDGGPTCKVGLKKFKCMTGGTHVAGRARRVGPACQDGLTDGTHMSRWTEEIQVYGRWVLH